MGFRRALTLVVAATSLAEISTAAAQNPPPVQASPTATQAQPADRAPASAGICIGIVLPSVQGVEGSATVVASAVRDLFASYLTGPTLQPGALDARLPSQALAEARQKQCAYVLTATVTRKHSGPGNSIFGQVVGQAIGSAAYQIPVAGDAAAAMAQGAVVAGAQAISTIAATTKAKDEIRLEYKLSTADGAVRLGPTTDKAKASVDGEDLLTPLVERAAEAIVARLAPR